MYVYIYVRARLKFNFYGAWFYDCLWKAIVQNLGVKYVQQIYLRKETCRILVRNPRRKVSVQAWITLLALTSLPSSAAPAVQTSICAYACACVSDIHVHVHIKIQLVGILYLHLCALGTPELNNEAWIRCASMIASIMIINSGKGIITE